MKKLILILFLVFLANNIAQTKKVEGKVTFVSAQNVYVQFVSTKGIEQGDTLYKKETLSPILIVKFKSSTSIAAELLNKQIKISKNDIVIANAKISEKKEEKQKKVDLSRFQGKSVKKVARVKREKYTGKIGITSYSNFSNTSNNPDYQRWRYALSLGAWNILESNFSLTSYATLNYRADQWNDVKSNLGNSLRVYDLAVNYKFADNLSFWLGRRINQKVANISVLDGGSVEYSFGAYSFGVLAGSRPNPSDFGVNFNYLEYGGYVSRVDSLKKGILTNTLAFMQQNNHSKIDRRFLYFQHSNSIFAKTNIFLSTEIDLYKNLNGKEEFIFRLTSLYLSVRYRFSNKVAISASYDERKNVIYYETYKTYAERLFDEAVRRGFRARVNIRPFKYVNVNLNAGFRMREGDNLPTINLGGAVTHSRLPFYNLSGTFNANFINTSYLTGGIVGVRLSRSYFDGFLYASMNLKGIFYSYGVGELLINQNVLGLDLSFNLFKKMALSLTYEGVFEGRDTFSRIFIGLNQRF